MNRREVLGSAIGVVAAAVLPAQKEAYALVHGKAGKFVLGKTIEVSAIFDGSELRELTWVDTPHYADYVKAIEPLPPRARIIALLKARAGFGDECHHCDDYIGHCPYCHRDLR